MRFSRWVVPENFTSVQDKQVYDGSMIRRIGRPFEKPNWRISKKVLQRWWRIKCPYIRSPAIIHTPTSNNNFSINHPPHPPPPTPHNLHHKSVQKEQVFPDRYYFQEKWNRTCFHMYSTITGARGFSDFRNFGVPCKQTRSESHILAVLRVRNIFSQNVHLPFPSECSKMYAIYICSQ